MHHLLAGRGQRWPAFALLALTVARASAQAQPPESRPTSASRPGYESFVFAWPVPARARVTERILKKGKTVVIRYSAALARHQNGADLLVTLRDFEFVAIEGVDLKDPAVVKALAPALALTSAIPDLRVAADGNLIEVEGLEELIERVTVYVSRASGGPDQKEQDQKEQMLRQAFKNPKLQNSVRESAGKFWMAWVGAWKGLGGLQRGEKADFTAQTKFGRQQIHAEHLGPADGHPNHVRLLMRTRFAEEDISESFSEFVQDLAREMGQQGDVRVDSCGVLTEHRTVTDPTRLLPVRAEFERKVRLKMQGKEEVQVEKREYDFDWSGKDRAVSPPKRR